HWTFDGPNMNWSSTTAEVLDRTSNANHGNLVNSGATAAASGKIGQSMSFDGVNDYVNAGNGSSSNITGNLTVSAWIKPQVGSGSQHIISKFAGGPACQYLLTTDSTGTLVYFYTGNGNTGNRAAGNILVNQWSHIVGIWDGIDTKIYINGSFIGNASSPLAPNLSGTNLYFGMDAGSASPYNGALDDVRIYNRAFSATEVTRLYRLGIGSKI
ncbi:MAG: LamG domain-containing protein, partial [Minisyncoccia bacterium]